MSNISDVTVFLPKGNGSPKIKANGSFVIGGSYKVKYTLFSGPKGLFVGLPGQYGTKVDPETGKKEWYPNVSCINDEAKRELDKAVIAAYNKKTGNTGANQGSAPEPSNQADDDGVPF